MEGTLDTPGPEGVFRLGWRGRFVYLLWRNRDAVLVGAGGPGHLKLIDDALEMRGLSRHNIKAVLLTHAEPLLAANLAKLRAESRLLAYINRLEAARLEPRPKKGWSLAALREKRLLDEIAYKAPAVDLYVADGDVLDHWYGLTVVSLPGTTPGNCGYYCRHLDILFTGALHRKRTLAERLLGPKPFDPEAEKASRTRVAGMKPKWVYES